jgi:hypothetical protein
MKKILSISLVLFFLSLYVVSAASDVGVSITPIKNIVAPIQNATYAITFVNNMNKDLTFELRYFEVDWRVSPDKVYVPSFLTKNQEITLIPQPPYTDDKPQIVRLVIASTDGSYRSENLLEVNVLKYNEILDQSISNFIVPDPLDPRKPTVINLRLINTKDAALDNINVKITSPLFEQKKVLTLGPSETTTLDFNLDLPQNTKYGSYPISAIVSLQDRILANFTTEMKIGNYPNTGEEKTVSSGFLYNSIQITKTNKGNSVSHETVTKTLGTFEKFFTKTNPKPTTSEKRGSNYILIWAMDLQPGESRVINIDTDYRVFVALFILLIIIAVVVYIFTKRDISIKKKLISIKKEEDGTSTIKISITVKNKSFTRLHNIKVMDRIPRVVEMPHEFGTAHPKVVEHPQGAQLIWEVVSLDANEERVFTYKARSKLQIIGKATIPSAVAKYNKKNRSLMVSSNPEQLL